MAVLVQMSVPGATTTQYEQLNDKAGISDDKLPNGLICHAAWVDGSTLHIQDVWESQGNFETFFGPLVPLMEDVMGGPVTTMPTFTELHNCYPKKRK